MEVFVDLEGHIDIEAEIARNEKEKANLEKMITGKRKKLENASFVERATAEIVQRERDSLADLEEKLTAIEAVLVKLAK